MKQGRFSTVQPAKLFIAIVMAIVLSVPAISLKSQVQSSLFENYSVNDGLTDKTIHCIFQDSKGLIWIATDFGVLWFDGYTFTKFSLNTPESKILGNTLIRDIYEDSKGIIWIGTENQGVFKYDRHIYGLEQFNNNVLSNNSVWTFLEGNNNHLWIGTENGLDYFNTKTNKVEKVLKKGDTTENLSGNVIRDLVYDRGDKLWVGTDYGITVLNPNNSICKKYLTNKYITSPREKEIWAIYADKTGNIWAGTYLGGLYKFNSLKDKFEIVKLDNDTPRSSTVRSIIQDKNGNIWFGTRGGLYELEKRSKTIKHYCEKILDEYSLVHNSVLCLFIDKKGDLWVGTRNGLSYLNFDRQAFGYITENVADKIQIHNSEVYSLWEDKNQDLWIGTENGGVNIYNKKKNSIRYITSSQGLSNNCIKAISPDLSGNILIGTYLGGLNQYNPVTGKNKIFKHNENDETSISDNSVFAIYTDNKDNIWIGTSTGVDIFSDKKGTFKHFGKKFEVGWVVMIYEDSEGCLWMYSEDLKKLTMISPGGVIRHFSYKSRAVCSDNQGYIWIGTMGNGLVRYDPIKNKAETFTTNQGLCSNVIYGMAMASDKYLWLSTNNGLSRFDIHASEFKNYYVNNGLLNNQFNYGASMVCSDGTLAFGGKKGVDFIYPDKLRENTYKPPVILTDFRLFNKSVKVGTEIDNKTILTNLISETSNIVLPYNQNMITFEFAALNYANSSKNRYKYKLIGFDKNWNDIGNKHTATYTNLDYGTYYLRVIGTNSDGQFNPKGLAVHLTILPPYWKTWWFRLLVVMFLLFLFYFIYGAIINREKLKHQLFFERQTARQIQELDRLKHQFFMNVSHEIRTPLSLIVGPLDKLISTEMNRNSEVAHLNIIKRNTVILSKLVNQLLDYRKLETGNLKPDLKKGNLTIFIQEIVDSFRQAAIEKNIELEYSTIQKAIFTWFDSDKMEKILNNLISNALKYTDAGGRVSVSVSLILIDGLDDFSAYLPPVDIKDQIHKQYIRIVVRDTGIGIPPAQTSLIFDRFRQIDNKNHKSAPGTGIGLSLTKELVKLHRGHIKVKSIEGKGSKFTLLIPFEQEDKANKPKVETNTGKDPFDVPEVESGGNNENPVNEQFQKNQPVLLVADDNQDIRIFIKHHFEPEYNVLEAKDGREGWEQTLEHIPDIIIADVMMPAVDGHELCRRIKDDERTSHIPVIMLTALTSKEKQLAGIDAGADDYILKPFDITVLKAKLDNLLYIRKALRERYSKEMLLKPKDIVLTSPDEKFLKKVIQVIEKNISMQELDVDFLARHVGVSRTQLYRKITALTDMAAKEFVKDIRLKRAAQLILQDKLNISEIAYEVGFNDISYFRKCFKEKYGMSATDYLKNHRA